MPAVGRPWPSGDDDEDDDEDDDDEEEEDCDEEFFSFGVWSVWRADKNNKDDYNIHYYQEEDARKLLSALPGPRYGFLLLIENR